MKRRQFLVNTAALASAGTVSWGLWQHLHEVVPTIEKPGQRLGHMLRNFSQAPSPTVVRRVDVLIVGSGAAGLSCAWQLAQSAPHLKICLLEGPQANGNLAHGQFPGDSYNVYEPRPYPIAAHYLPLPSMESAHVRKMLYEFGVIRAGHESIQPEYDERYLVHAPYERLWINGRWEEGLLPKTGLSKQDQLDIERFFEQIQPWKEVKGQDGKRPFTVPRQWASQDPAWRILDTYTFKQWLDQQGYKSPALLWYLDYCCRDDYWAGLDKVSAWAGLHYFCARNGQAANAEPGSTLTWPNGLGWVAEKLRQAAKLTAENTLAASAYRIQAQGTGYDVDVLHNALNETLRIHTPQLVLACPLFVARHLLKDNLAFSNDFPFAPRAPWLVGNYWLKAPLPEPEHSVLAWDNVLFQSPGLGFVNASHQRLRVVPERHPVLTSYYALAQYPSPEVARQFLEEAPAQTLLDLATQELRSVYGTRFSRSVQAAMLYLHGHAMAIPSPGFLSQPAPPTQPGLHFAHADLSGYSVFEEASDWGIQAALNVIKQY